MQRYHRTTAACSICCSNKSNPFPSAQPAHTFWSIFNFQYEGLA
jgi:hypothetical protein